MASPRFIHLRVHSAYSLSEGAVRLPQLINFCETERMPAIAITDSNNLFGALEFSQMALKAGVQPILGCALDMQPLYPPASLRGSASHQPTPDKLVLYAQNEQGYYHLLDLVSESFLSPVEEPGPLLTYDRLEGRTDGLIALTAGPAGTIGRLFAEGRKDKAHAATRQLMQLFPDRLYIELHRHGLEIERAIEPQLVALAGEHRLPLVATNDVYFPNEEMYAAHDALLCIADSTYVLEEKRRHLTPKHHLRSVEEMCAVFADLPEALDNTVQIARRCAFASPPRDPILPSFVENRDAKEGEEFERIAREGLQWRLEHFVFEDGEGDAARKEKAAPYWERLEFELSIIQQMGFPGYFLIVSDFISWSKQHEIPVGPGRGSGAGSLVAWAMKITDLDPLRFGLLFERFLNPERVSMPDFDVDFCQDRRDETIRYVQQKYGKDKVAQIITFGKLQARAVLRDVGRVLQLPYPVVDRICKLVPNNPANPVTLPEAIEVEPLLQRAIREDEQVAEMVDIAKKLEGLYRHSSTHAAGVVIGDRPLHALIPLYRDPRSDMPVVQFSMKYAEMAGLVKFDFLGLKTLTVLARACQFILETDGRDIELLMLPFDDKPTFELLGRGDAIGVFQLESAGMRDTLRKLKPDTFEDIIAIVSLYRPGPMDNIPTYIARKHGKEKPQYPHPMIQDILEETFGVIIYQEQVMQIAQVMGGYSLGQADILRRAMGKKIQEEMDKQRDIFIDGAKAKGVDEVKATEVFDLMAKFASYGFNKSHAAAYALIAYQTAYLKANYTAQFFCGLMCLDCGNTEKLDLFRQDAESMGVAVLPPDINRSGANFTVEAMPDELKEAYTSPLAIRYALGALKNVGLHAMEALVAERDANGPYADIFDVAQRLDGKVVNRRQLEYLIKAGVFDSLNANRRQIFEAIDTLVQHATHTSEAKDESQASLFGEEVDVSPASRHLTLPDCHDWPVSERLQHEFGAVGFYLSAHPLESYTDILKKLGVSLCDSLPRRLKAQYEPVKTAGIVLGRKVKVSPKGKFAFLSLSDPSGSYEVSVFNEALLNERWEQMEEGTMLVIEADGKLDESGPRLIAQGITVLEEVLAVRPELGLLSSLTLQLGANADLNGLKTLLDKEREQARGAAARGQLMLELGLEQEQIRLKAGGAYILPIEIPAKLAEITGVEVLAINGKPATDSHAG